MKNLIFILLLFSCSSKMISYDLPLNVKEFNGNELTSCRFEKVSISENKGVIKFLDLSLTYSGQYQYKDSEGNLYNVTREINNAGLIITAVSRDRKSYIISTSGKCH